MTNSRLNFPALQRAFADTSQTQLRVNVSNVANRLLALLGGDPGDITAPGVPTNLVATPGITQVALTWTPPADLDVAFYRVQRSTSSGSGFSVITTTIGTSIIDSGLTGGTAYYYKVAAVDTSGNVGSYSSEVSATPAASPGAGTAPAAPANLVAVAGDTAVALQWDLVEGAVSYLVQRSTTSGSGYSTVAQGIVGVAGQDYAVWLDTGRTNGTAYYYVVKALNANGDTSAASEEASATPVAAADTTAPPLPTLVTLTALTGAIKVQWDSVIVPDLAYYSVYWSLDEEGPFDTLDVQPGLGNTAGTTGVTLEGLDEDTEYFVYVTAVDTSGNEIDETAALEALGEPYSTTTLATEIVYTTPAAPTGLAVTEVGNGQVSFSWNAVTSPYMVSYIMQARTSTSAPWVQLPDSVFLYPAVAGTIPGLTNETNYQFRLFARNAGGLTSEPSNIVNATPSVYPGGVVIGGSGDPGTGTAGAISGDTGLGANHKAPGATFDYVLDVSHLISGPLFSYIGQMLTEIHNAAVVSGGTQGFNMAGKRIAILLPEKVHRFQDVDPQFMGVSLFGQTWNRESCQVPILDDTQWHFIAPWPTDDISDTDADAYAEADKKFTVRSTTPEGYGFNVGSDGEGQGMLQLGTQGARNRIGFWYWQMDGGPRCTVAGEGPGDYGKGGLFVTYHGCRMTHPHHFPNINSVSGVSGLLNINCCLPRFTISTYRVSHDVIRWCYIDSPYNSEHHLYERNAPPGDAYIEDTYFGRCGGQVLQETRRIVEGPDFTNGRLSGTRYWRRVNARYYGRNWWSAGFMSQYGSHRIQDFEDCVIICDNPGRSQVWPPSNLATLGTDEHCEGPYGDAPGAAENFNNPHLFVMGDGSGGGGLWPMHSEAAPYTNHFNAKIKMRDCWVYLKNPGAGAIVVVTAAVIDIADCGIFTSTNNVGMTIMQYGNDGVPAPFGVGQILLANNNTSAILAAFRAEYAFVPSSPNMAPYIRYYAPPPLNANRGSTPGNPITSGSPINGATLQTASVNITNLQ